MAALPDEGLTGSALAKRLASCKKATRDRAIRLLRGWLPASPSITDEDLLKIWKGLFYCMWHADKTPAQQDLAVQLSSLLLPLHPSLLAPRYLSSFLSTIRREWSGIDHHRLDKFYSLIRSFVRHLFAFLSDHRWDPQLVASMLGVLSEKCLLCVEKYPSRGVDYHVAQVFLDELQSFLPLDTQTLDALLKPFFDVLGVSKDKTMITKIRVNIFDRLLDNGRLFLAELKSTGEAKSRETVVDKFGRIGLVFGFSKRFLELASAESTIQSSRKLMYELHEKFSKLEKNFEISGIKLLLEAPEKGDLEHPNSFITDEMNVDKFIISQDCDSGERPSKKRKKSKKGLRTDGKRSAGQEIFGTVSEPVANASTGVSVALALSSDLLVNDANVAEDVVKDDDTISFNKILMSNLQKQFEKVAAEEGIVTPVSSFKIKKRKRVKSSSGSKSAGNIGAEAPSTENRIFANGKSAESSIKRVRFSMKNNLIWKPHSPLPPHSLRLPPSATPRGSALKKGVPAGPVKEITPPSSKIAKSKVKSNSLKKLRRNTKSVSPGLKRVRKLQSLV